MPGKPLTAAFAPAETPPPEARPTGAPPRAAASNWRYTGPPGRIYTNVPVTVTTGDIIAWPQAPADDGAWEPTTGAATTLPDNHRPEPEPTAAPEEA